MEPQFLASHWTIAGNCHPTRDRGISRIPIDVRVEAIAKVGYRGISFFYADLAEIRRNPKWRDYREIDCLLKANGIEFVELDLLIDWFMDGPRGQQASAITTQLMEAAEALGGHHIKVLGDPYRQFPLDRMAEPFANLCGLAAAVGAQIAIEAGPLTNLVKPSEGIKLIEDSGASNAGLLLDIWHVARSGVPYDQIAEIPGALIVGVELNDADKEPRGPLSEDTLNNRKLCGEGDLNPKAFIDAIRRTGYGGFFAVEILSDAHRALPLEDAVRVSIDTTRAQFIGR